MLVKLENKTLYFNSHGEKEFEITENVGIMYGEEIIKVVYKNRKKRKYLYRFIESYVYR